MSKWDLAVEIAIVAIISAVMVALRYNRGWVDAGFLDILGIIATCDPAISAPGFLVVVWLLRFGVSCIVASIIFWKAGNGRSLNYVLVIAAAFLINLLMGLGGMILGE